MMDKGLLRMIPVIGDEKLSEILENHRKTTGLDYADTPEIMSYTIKCEEDADKSNEIAESLISRLTKK